MTEDDPRAVRLSVGGAVQGVGFRAATQQRALAVGVKGWVRNEPDGTLAVHAEGPAPAVDRLLEFLAEGPPGAQVEDLRRTDVSPEGHEQFAIRGVSAGRFVVQEHTASTHHFDLRLEVGRAMRSWAVPKGPSMDPAVKRLAVEVPDHDVDASTFEGSRGSGAVILWDQGSYEQGGRVAWPQALERGHAVFVLHGEKLAGGFALQRTGSGGRPQWLLIKRRDEYARPGSDVVGDQPRSVLSSMTLEEVLGGRRSS